MAARTVKQFILVHCIGYLYIDKLKIAGRC